MIEFATGIIMQYLPIIILVAVLVLIGWIINLFDSERNMKNRVNWKADDMPCMKPIKIDTKKKGFWGAIWMWAMGRRTWIITENFYFELNGIKYMIPKGFIFDGASVPKFLSSWLSPVGILLMGGLIHDFIYRKTYLLRVDKIQDSVEQKEGDMIFRDINIEINGFIVLNYLAFYALRCFGWFAWRSNRKKFNN